MIAVQLGDIVTRSDGVQYMIIEKDFKMEDISSDVILLPVDSILANNLIGRHIGDDFNYNKNLKIKNITHTNYLEKLNKHRTSLNIANAFNNLNFQLAEELNLKTAIINFDSQKNLALDTLRKMIYDDTYNKAYSPDVADMVNSAISAGAISDNEKLAIAHRAEEERAKYDKQQAFERTQLEKQRQQDIRKNNRISEVRSKTYELIENFKIKEAYELLLILAQENLVTRESLSDFLQEDIGRAICDHVEKWNIQGAEKLAKIASSIIHTSRYDFFTTLSNALRDHDLRIQARQQLIQISEDGLQFGACLDLYTTSSSVDDCSGSYINEYSELGKDVHDIKYNKSLSDANKLDIITSRIIPRLYNKTKNMSMWYRDIIVTPMPFTHERTMQPVYEIAKQIANRMNVKYDDAILSKHSLAEAKKSEDSFGENDFAASYCGNRTSILIIDDTYGRGNSLRACIQALKELDTIRDIYYIGIVKNRSGGLVGQSE